MTVLVFALAVGFVQIVVGMAVKFWMLCRDGQVWDAVWDVGTWWVIFAGIGLLPEPDRRFLRGRVRHPPGAGAGLPDLLAQGPRQGLRQGDGGGSARSTTA